MDTPGRCLRRNAQPIADLTFDTRCSGVNIKSESASVEPRWRNVAKYDVGIRYGRLQAAETVADGARIRAGTVGPHGDHTSICASDASASCADLHHFDRRNVNRQTA